jgi:predicted DNA-binding transcriptional regulator AlpA
MSDLTARDDSSTPVGLAEIADRLHIREQTVWQWHARDQLPEPRYVVARKSAWAWGDIERWARETGRLPSAPPPPSCTEQLRALSIRQPYASQIMTGTKDVETRKWRTNVRGRIAIHATRRPELDDLPTSAILGTVEIVDCVREPSKAALWHFLLSDPRPLAEPIPISGSQGWWHVPDELVKQLD